MTYILSKLKDDWKTLWQVIRKNRLQLLLIAFTILLGNIMGIVGDQGLYLDDHFRHFFATHKQFPWYIGERNYVRPFILYPIYKLLPVSPYLARFCETVLFLIPVSWLFFLMLRNLFMLPISLSVAAAILPAILPAQEAIPSFIDGCYTVQGLLSAMPVIFFGHRFVTGRRWHDFAIAAGFYALGLEMMDHTIFLAGPFGAWFLYQSWKAHNPKGLWLLLALALLAGRKVVQSILHPVSANQLTSILPDEVIHRFRLSFFQSNPFAFAVNWLLDNPAALSGVLLSFFLMSAGLVYLVPALRRKLAGDESEYPVIVAWALIWTASTALPFMLVSPHYSSRYMHIPAYGANLAILLSLWLMFRGVGGRKALHAVLIGTVIISASLRQVYLQRHFEPSNRQVRLFRSELNARKFAEGAQIAIVGAVGIPTGEHWHYSSSAIQFYTGRLDLHGNFGKEQFFYNPFDAPDGQAFTFRMHGFETGRPTYLFRFDGYNFHPIGHALQWHSETNRWSLLHFDLMSGEKTKELEGTGRPALEKALDRNQISRDGVLWYQAQ